MSSIFVHVITDTLHVYVVGNVRRSFDVNRKEGNETKERF